MAISLPGGDPDAVAATDVTSVTTSSFTRPASGVLLVAMAACSSDATPTFSGGSLTWTKRREQVNVDQYAQIWTAPVSGSGSMTATLTFTGSLQGGGLKIVYVVGHNSANLVGSGGGGTSTTNNITVSGYTSTVDGSRGFFSGLENSGRGVPTSTDTGYGWNGVGASFDTSGIAVVKAVNTPTSGSTVTFNADAAGSSQPAWTWCALEILPAPDSRATVVAVSRAAAHRAASR